MTQANTGDTDDTDAKGGNITTVRVSFEDLKQVLKKRQERQSREETIFRISPSWGGFDDVETATIERRDPAAHYPEGNPHIDIHPVLLYGVEHPLRAPDAAQYPDWTVQRGECRDHHGFTMEEDMGTLFEEWWDIALDRWEGELKLELRDEFDLYANAHGPEVQSVLVEIEWTDLD